MEKYYLKQPTYYAPECCLKEKLWLQGDPAFIACDFVDPGKIRNSCRQALLRINVSAAQSISCFSRYILVSELSRTWFQN